MARKSSQLIEMLTLVTVNGAVFRTAQADACMLQDYQTEATTETTYDDDGNIIDSQRGAAARARLEMPEVRSAYANVINMAAELRLPELRAVFTRRKECKRVNLSFVSWARSGILHRQDRTTAMDRLKNPKVRGESDYTCMFCFQSITTFGWAQGVRSLPDAFVRKLEQHVGPCAVDFLVNYTRERDTWQTTPGVPPLVDHERLVRKEPP